MHSGDLTAALAHVIRCEREHLGLTQLYVYKTAKMSRAKWERLEGHLQGISAQDIERIAPVLKLKPWQLVKRAEEQLERGVPAPPMSEARRKWRRGTDIDD